MNLIPEISAVIGHIPIKEVILQAGIAKEAARICQNQGKSLLICDENTKDFVNCGSDKLVLPAKQKPTLEAAQEISKHNADLFIAVGSGSISDIVKYGSYLAKKPYIVFGTAPSMNGYVSANASLLDAGYKKSFSAHAPLAVYLDTEILAAAPKRLIISGVGDSICRGTVEADVLLSAEVTGSPRYTELFQLMKREEEKIFDDVEALTKTLIYSGIAMLHAHSSAPASQSEHMIAHYMELMQPDAPHSFHGEQIAVTTISAAKLQEKILDSVTEFEITKPDDQEVIKHFGAEFGKYCLEQTEKKYKPVYGKKFKLNKSLIEKSLIRSEEIHKKLKSIQAPTTAEELGWNSKTYANSLNYTKYTRDRFTFLDLI